MKTNWDNQWEREANQTYWNEPDKHVMEFSDTYGIGNDNTVLDLGCGIGRHAIYLSMRDSLVYAIDESATAIEKLREKVLAFNMNIKTQVCDYLSFDTEKMFDYIIAFNVIYHGGVSHFSKSILKCYEL